MNHKPVTPILVSVLGTRDTCRVNWPGAKKTYSSARKSYYESGSSKLTDAQYDALEDLLREFCPEYKLLNKTGAKVGKKSARDLLFPMPSLAKIKVENEAALARFFAELADLGEERLAATSKVDGSSVQVIYKDGVLNGLITRGDGLVGKDISHLIPYVTRRSQNSRFGLPREISIGRGVCVLRMEAAVPRRVHAAKYAEEYASDRAMASAVFNRHDASPALAHVKFVLLSCLSRQRTHDDLDVFASLHGFERPLIAKVPVNVTSKRLQSIMANMNEVSEFSLDGLVVGPLSHIEEISDSRPKLTRSVKVDDFDNAPTTTIREIVWQPSAHGVLVPKAVIEPVMFGSVSVKHVALHNVGLAKRMGVGVGAVVRVMRSGEIIPKITEVITPAEFHMPSESDFGPLAFDGVRVTINDSENKPVSAKKLQRMFNHLDLQNLGPGFAEKLVDAGFATTIAVVNMELEDIKALPGVKTTAHRIYNQLSRVRNGEFTLPKLMAASCVFKSGLGETTVSKLIKDYPGVQLSSLTYKQVAESIGPARASAFISGRPAFLEWLKATGIRSWAEESEENKPVGPLTGSMFSWTGYRSKEEENYVKSLGGEVVPFGSKTTVLFYTPEGKTSSKVSRAGNRSQTFRDWRDANARLLHG